MAKTISKPLALAVAVGLTLGGSFGLARQRLRRHYRLLLILRKMYLRLQPFPLVKIFP